MAIEPGGILLLGGSILASGFLVHSLLRKVGTPDILFLLLLGILLGPALGVLDRGLLLEAAPLVSAIALGVILLEGGLSVNPEEVARGGLRGGLLAVLGVLFAAATAALAFVLLLGWNPLWGLLFGLAVAPTGTVVVLALLKQLPVRDDAAAVLTFETAINDTIAILMALVLLDVLAFRQSSPVHLLQAMFGPLLLGLALGMAGGFLVSLALRPLRGQMYFYTLILAAAFIVYGAAELLGGLGPVGALVFGLVLANPAPLFRGRMRARAPGPLDRAVRGYHAEVTFLVRSFFFVFVGALVTISGDRGLLYGAGLTALLLLSRYPAVVLCTTKSGLRESQLLMTLMMPKGLSTAVLATLILGFAARNPGALPPSVAREMVDAVFAVMVLSIVLATLGCYLATRGRGPTPGKAEDVEAGVRRKMVEAAFEWWRSEAKR